MSSISDLLWDLVPDWFASWRHWLQKLVLLALLLNVGGVGTWMLQAYVRHEVAALQEEVRNVKIPTLVVHTPTPSPTRPRATAH